MLAIVDSGTMNIEVYMSFWITVLWDYDLLSLDSEFLFETCHRTWLKFWLDDDTVYQTVLGRDRLGELTEMVTW